MTFLYDLTPQNVLVGIKKISSYVKNPSMDYHSIDEFASGYFANELSTIAMKTHVWYEITLSVLFTKCRLISYK
jgi:hypothetical protein